MVFRRYAGYMLGIVLLQALLAGANARGQEWKSGVEWKEPPVVRPGASNGDPPSDAIVLFNGTDLSQWEGGERWLVKEGVAIPQAGEIRTKQSFGDIQLHIEWAAPTEIEGEGQGRGNSGVFLMGVYEVQVLDSFENPTYFDGQAAAIYKQTPPMVNAMRRPGEWNTYDILFTAPKFRVNGALSKPAFVTLFHNGVVVLHHFEILGSTGFTAAPTYTPHAEKGPIALQFHNDPVRFRNIWVRELKAPAGHRVGPPFNVQRPKPPRRKRDESSEKDEPKPESKSDASKPPPAKLETTKPDTTPEAAEKSAPGDAARPKVESPRTEKKGDGRR